MRLGIGSYTYVWSVGVPRCEQPARPLTACDLLERASRLGVGLVQLCDNLPIHQLAPQEIDSLVAEARRREIDFEAGTSGIQPEHLRMSLALARRLGSPFLRVVVDTPTHQPSPDETVATLASVLPEFARENVTLAIENHDRFDAQTLREIVHRLNSDHLGICFDTANSIGCLESAERVLDLLGPYVVNVHIKDYALFRPVHNKGFVVEGRPAGAGDLDVPALLERVRGFGRDPNVIAELWPPPQPTLHEAMQLEERWAAQSVAYLRKFISD